MRYGERAVELDDFDSGIAVPAENLIRRRHVNDNRRWPEPVYHHGESVYERVTGLRHLADVVATIHLSSAIPIIDQGVFGRFGAEDSLTDLWLRFYDVASDSDHSIGASQGYALRVENMRGKRLLLFTSEYSISSLQDRNEDLILSEFDNVMF